MYTSLYEGGGNGFLCVKCEMRVFKSAYINIYKY